jgi:hypothetical protein
MLVEQGDAGTCICPLIGPPRLLPLVDALASDCLRHRSAGRAARAADRQTCGVALRVTAPPTEKDSWSRRDASLRVGSHLTPT